MHHVLTTTKSDFQPNGFSVKAGLQVKRRAIRVHIPVHKTGRQRGKVFIQIAALAVLKMFAFKAAIEIAMRAFRMCHGAGCSGAICLTQDAHRVVDHPARQNTSYVLAVRRTVSP